ncbi:hypothetical protein, partial [Frankia sp. AgKG'84/4]|uniref:hypothetical protein n=1 Tax=Frankia sp. AgKG'84/4 TaxID=573490 RepID=UPI00202A82C0
LDHTDGITLFLRAAADADPRYTALYTAAGRLHPDVARIDTGALRADGAALLAACGAAGLPH